MFFWFKNNLVYIGASFYSFFSKVVSFCIFCVYLFPNFLISFVQLLFSFFIASAINYESSFKHCKVNNQILQIFGFEITSYFDFILVQLFLSFMLLFIILLNLVLIFCIFSKILFDMKTSNINTFWFFSFLAVICFIIIIPEASAGTEIIIAADTKKDEDLEKAANHCNLVIEHLRNNNAPKAKETSFLLKNSLGPTVIKEKGFDSKVLLHLIELFKNPDLSFEVFTSDLTIRENIYPFFDENSYNVFIKTFSQPAEPWFLIHPKKDVWLCTLKHRDLEISKVLTLQEVNDLFLLKNSEFSDKIFLNLRTELREGQLLKHQALSLGDAYFRNKISNEYSLVDFKGFSKLQDFLKQSIHLDKQFLNFQTKSYFYHKAYDPTRTVTLSTIDFDSYLNNKNQNTQIMYEIMLKRKHYLKNFQQDPMLKINQVTNILQIIKNKIIK